MNNNLIKSDKIFTPQAYLEGLTNRCYFLKNYKNPIREIENILDTLGFCLWNYPLTEIEHCIENKIPVVLVDVSHYNNKGIYIQEFRWFEVDEDFNYTE